MAGLTIIKNQKRDYDASKLSPKERLESLYDRNYRPSGDKEADNKTQAEFEKAYQELKNER